MAKVVYSEKIVLPKNTYKFKVRTCVERINQTSKEAFLSWEWEVVSPGPHYGEVIQYAMNPKVLPGSESLSFLLACGMPKPEKPRIEFDTDTFLGCTFWAMVDVGETKGINKQAKNTFTTFWSEAEYVAMIQQYQPLPSQPQFQQAAPPQQPAYQVPPQQVQQQVATQYPQPVQPQPMQQGQPINTGTFVPSNTGMAVGVPPQQIPQPAGDGNALKFPQ